MEIGQKIEGHWWRPEEPELKVGGTLTILERGAELGLLGTFDGQIPDPVLQTQNQNVIHGITTQNDWVTLIDCFPSGSNYQVGPGSSTSNQKYTAEGALFGAHYDYEELHFHSVKVGFQCFSDWVRPIPVSQSVERSNPPYVSEGDTVSFEYTYPQSYVATTEDFTVSLLHNINVSGRFVEGKSISINHE